jgi:hypothetical protein
MGNLMVRAVMVLAWTLLWLPGVIASDENRSRFAGWQNKLLGWPVLRAGVAPFAGPIALWLLIDSALLIFSSIGLIKTKREAGVGESSF